MSFILFIYFLDVKRVIHPIDLKVVCNTIGRTSYLNNYVLGDQPPLTQNKVKYGFQPTKKSFNEIF
jgi:hypothetical protein